MAGTAQPRSYDASGRRAQAQANRDRVIVRARELFIARGFANTSVADVARAAGVSAPTVFAMFGSKANLLKVAAETAIVGDTQPVAMAERPEMRRIETAGTAGELLDGLADLIAARAPEIFPIYSVMYAAQDSHSEIADLVALADDQRLAGATRLAGTLAERLGVRSEADLEILRDGLWSAMSVLHYRLLVVERGWPINRYRDWVRAMLQIPVEWIRS